MRQCMSHTLFLYRCYSLVICCSQLAWPAVLTYLCTKPCLRDASFRLDGQMTREVQAQNLSFFRSDSSNTVFLISLRAGGTGLNLPCASSVVLVRLPAGGPAYCSVLSTHQHSPLCWTAGMFCP